MEILFARTSSRPEFGNQVGTVLTDEAAREAIEAGAVRLQVSVGPNAFRPFLGLPQAQQEMLASIMGASLAAMRDSALEALRAEAQEAHILWRQAYAAYQQAGTRLGEAQQATEQAGYGRH